MITGKMLRDAIISGANYILNEAEAVNALNVFPVPDGDTGTNMSMTFSAAKKELIRLEDNATVSEVSKITAAAMLRGARGNSGVISSLIFRGISKGLAGKDTASFEDMANALALGASAAYKAVMKPTEGTILTVIRVASEGAAKVKDTKDKKEFWDTVLESADDALAKTPELLPVLKKAGVVDSGGKGISVVLHGLAAVLRDDKPIELEENQEQNKNFDTATFFKDEHGFSGEITFNYCTEFIVLKENQKEPLELKSFLETIGDCVVVVDDEDIIKVHVHTNNPDKAIGKAFEFGSLTDIKIDNLKEEFEETKKSNSKKQAVAEQNEMFPYAQVDPNKKYGFVSVCAGEGIEELFRDLGVDNIVSGGQTMNPSTDDILRAIHATPAQTVFVLPNNKNIIMAAEQTTRLADRKVMVLQTKTIPQGISAMLNIDDSLDSDELYMAMSKASENVSSGSVTFAARDSVYDNHNIKKGEMLALDNGKVSFTTTDLKEAVVKLTKNLVKKKDASFVTLIYGNDLEDEKAEEINKAVINKLGPNVDVSLVNGKQPVYYFLISVE